MRDESADGALKAFLIFMSLLAGLTTYLVLAEPRQPKTLDFNSEHFLIAIGVALAYPIVGAITVKFCTMMRNLAHPDGKLECSVDGKLILGAIWPLSLLASFVIYSFLAIIHRLFK